MNFAEALGYLSRGIGVKLELEDGSRWVISPEAPEETVLDITVEQALREDWQIYYGASEYKSDMAALADIVSRLYAAGIQLVSNGEELKEIETVTPDVLKFKPGHLSYYNGKWTLK